MGLREMTCVKTWLFGVSNLGSHLTRAVFFITTGVLSVSCDCTQPFSIMGFHWYNYSPFLFPLCPLIQYFIILWYNILLSFDTIFYYPLIKFSMPSPSSPLCNLWPKRFSIKSLNLTLTTPVSLKKESCEFWVG